MPTRITQFPPDGWQIVHRADGHWLQQRRDDDSWSDVAGPYRQRGTATAHYRRLYEREIRAMRKANRDDPRLPEHCAKAHAERSVGDDG
jgi:hypothetical protein